MPVPNVATLTISGRNDLSPAINAAAKDLQRLAQLAQQLGSSAGGQASGISRLGGAITQTGTAATGATQALTRTVREQQQLANLTIRTAQLQGNYAQALNIVERELGQASAGSIRYQSLLNKQIQLTNQATRASDGVSAALPRTFAGFTKDGITQLASLSAAYVGLGAVANKVSEGFTLNATLEQQRKTINTLVGDVAKGGAAMDAASEFARKYGFTQREAGEAASAAATLIRTSNTELGKQFEILGRLASLNPAEGISGATFSVKELASGDITSIVERFNLGRDAARAMKEEIANGRDVFAVLGDTLDRMGVSVDVLSNRMEGATGSINRGKQASEDLAIALGNIANSGGAVAVLDFLSTAASGLAGILNGSLPTGADAFHASLISGTQTYEEYAAAIDTAVAALYNSGEAIAARQFATEQLTEAEFIAAKATEDLAAGQANAAAHGREHAQATAEAAGAADSATTALQAAALATAQQAAEAQLAAQASTGLADAARAAAAELYASGDASTAARAQMAAQYGVTTSLVDVYYQLAQAARAAAIAQAGVAAATQNVYDDAGNVIPGRGSRRPPGAGGENAARAAEAEARSAAIVATGTQAQKLAELIRIRDQYTKGTAKYIAANTAVVQQQQAIAAAANKATTKTGRSASSDAAALEAARDALRTEEQKLAVRRKELATTTSETRRLELTKEIRDIEQSIAAKRKQAADAASRDAESRNREAQQAADALEASRDALRTDEEKLAKRRADLAGADTETERNTLTREILDLEKRISDEREKQAEAAKAAQRAAIDAAQAQIENTRKTRDEEKELAAARRVLASDNSTAELRQAAQLRIDEIALDRQERALEIAEKLKDASAAVAQNTQETANASGRIQGGPYQGPMLNTGTTLPTSAPAAAVPVVAAPSTPLPVTVDAPALSADLGATLRGVLDGARLVLEGPDGTFRPAHLVIAAERLQVGKRG